MHKLSLILLLNIVFARFVFAQLEAPPEGGTPKDFKLPEKTTFELENGLKATLVPFGDLPKVTVRIMIRVGNLNEPADKIWLADLTGDLMKEGTKMRSAERIAKDAAAMGGQVEISVHEDQSSISGDVLSEFGPKLVKLLAEITQTPLLPESEVERLKTDLIRNLSISKSQPRSLVREKFCAELFGDHPYGRIFPTEEMLKSYAVDDIRAFYADNFGARRTHVYVAGKFDPREMERAIRRSFRNWQAGPEPLINVPKATSKRVIYLIDRPEAAQSTLFIGLPVVDPSHEDFTKLTFTNQLLGGSFTSRITTNIREDKGYTYSPSSQISSRYHSAFWVMIADVTTNVTGPAIREIFYEIDRLQDEPPSADELRNQQNYAAGIFVLRNASRSGIIGQLSFLDFHDLPESYMTEYVARIFEISPEDVQTMARQYLKDQEMLIVVAGDSKTIRNQLSNYGPILE